MNDLIDVVIFLLCAADGSTAARYFFRERGERISLEDSAETFVAQLYVAALRRIETRLAGGSAGFGVCRRGGGCFKHVNDHDLLPQGTQKEVKGVPFA